MKRDQARMSTSSSSVTGSGSVASSTIANSLASSTGLNSGMDIDGIISKLIAIDQQPIDAMTAQQTAIKQQQAAYTAIQTKTSALMTSIKNLTNRNFDGTSLFDSMTTSSSNATVATATAVAGSAAQTINLEVKSLPTQTRASSTGLVGKFDTTATLSQLGVTAGSFTMYVNNQAHTYNVTASQTVGDVFNAITADFGTDITPSIVNGKINLAYTGGSATNIQFGSGSDNSNFLSKMHLDTAINDGTGNITASQGATTFSTSTALSSFGSELNTPITDGTFSINGINFDTTGKSLSQVLTDINSSSANVVANFNSTTNRFELSSKNTGSSLIKLADGTGNFLTAMNMINGSDTTSSQTSGKNAQFVLNGITMYSTSTSVNQNVTGLTGITLNLNQALVGTTLQLTVASDTSTISSAVSDVINKYNAVITAIDAQTDSTSDSALLKGDSRLKDLRNTLRTLFTSKVSGVSSTYDSLQQVGITTGAVGTGAANKGSPQLQFDSSKLLSALAADPTSIRKLFIGRDLTGSQNGGLGDDNMEGSLTKISHLISDQLFTDGKGGYGALYAGTGTSNQGLFASYQTSAQSRIQALNDSISRAQDRLALKQTRLRQQYEAMDTLIGQYQQQGTAVNSLINSLKTNG
jgi:flagellar hook-associated protein 2